MGFITWCCALWTEWSSGDSAIGGKDIWHYGRAHCLLIVSVLCRRELEFFMFENIHIVQGIKGMRDFVDFFHETPFGEKLG